MHRLTRLVVDPSNPRSLSAGARRRRWDRFTATFPDLENMRVLDLGGTPQFWHATTSKPAAVTAVNLGRFDSDDLVTAVQGDACDPPAELRRETFDIVVSNSLIEHVGGHAQRRRLADVIHSAAGRHWVQTPYRYFPVEPHWLFPGLQFLPFPARVAVTQRWPLGHMRRPDRASAVAAVHEVELLSATQMRDYFPSSTLWMERVVGIPKSLVAVRS